MRGDHNLGALSLRVSIPLQYRRDADLPVTQYLGDLRQHSGVVCHVQPDVIPRFQVADGGTLLLDEVTEIPLELQGKLLRVLQEGQLSRVGEDRVRQVDVRVVAATNRDLRREVEDGRFREDLFYRLMVFPIDVPPLRERHGDIPLLAAHFLRQATRRRKVLKGLILRQRDVAALLAYDWPGNVRELQNVIERAVITARGGALRFDLPNASAGSSPPPPMEQGEVVPEAEMRRRERANLLAALQQTDWKISGAGGAAELLGVRPTTLSSRIKKLGLVRNGR